MKEKAKYVFKGILVLCATGAVYLLADLALTYNFFDFKTDYKEERISCYEKQNGNWVKLSYYKCKRRGE